MLFRSPVQRPESAVPLNWNFPAKIGPETGKQVKINGLAGSSMIVQRLPAKLCKVVRSCARRTLDFYPQKRLLKKHECCKFIRSDGSFSHREYRADMPAGSPSPHTRRVGFEVRPIWSAPRGSPGIQNSVVPDAQRMLACCGPSASSVRSGGILAGTSTCLNKNHRSRQPDIQELPLRTTSQTAKHPKQTKHGPEEQSCCECLSSAQGQKPP